MAGQPLTSLNEYSRFVAELLSQPPVERSTVTVWSASPYTGVAEGEIFFANNLRLRLSNCKKITCDFAQVEVSRCTKQLLKGIMAVKLTVS